ncbi:Csu type fimbrial protein [Lonsdalea quercina]|uniref:Csu type fimbrial protein n=1 Tax=Lonsdalea quercina TaxID=71657 RepID=UPI0039747AA5
MKTVRSLALSLLSTALTLSVVSAAHAATGSLTGEIGVQLTIGEGCTVSNNNSSSGTNEWGTLNFGEYADLTSAVNGTVIGKDGSSTVSITCSNGLSPSLALDGGLYGTSSVRNLSSNGGSTVIPYHLYSDSGRSSEIAINGSLSLNADGSAQSIPIYGRISPSDQSTTAPASGTYTDTVTATLSW